jgi:hypothetical protein
MNRGLVVVAFLVALGWPSAGPPASTTIPVWIHNNTEEAVVLEVHVYDPSNREVLVASKLLGHYGIARVGNITAAAGDWALIAQTPGRELPVRLFQGNIEVHPGDAWVVRFERQPEPSFALQTGRAEDIPFPGNVDGRFG